MSTLLSGQSFSWSFIDEVFIGTTKNRLIKLKYEDDNLFWQTYPQKDDFKFLRNYLRLDVDYESILKKISKDEHIKKAIIQYPNLRLLKQDFDLTLLSFIISANNNIKSIRKSINLINYNWGKKVNVDGESYYLFPDTEILARLSLDELKKSKIGFRAKYVKEAANKLMKVEKYKNISNLSEADAKALLLEFKGVGDKVADCVLTFGLGFDNVTPIDRWVFRMLDELYEFKDKKYENARNWIINYFEGNAAWAGQFLFEYIRNYKPEDYI